MRRLAVLAAVLLVPLIGVRPSKAPAAACQSNPPGQIVACAGQFWEDGTPVTLRGLNTSGVGQLVDMTDEDYAKIASWHMNVVRMRVGWKYFEPNPPQPDGQGGWIHDYRTGLVSELLDQIQFANNHGIAVLIENRCFCGDGWPLWVAQAPYNSHHRTYDLGNKDDRNQFLADYWSDDLLKQFTTDWLTNLTTWVKDSPGLLGYGLLNEPNTGNLPNTHETTQISLDWQLELAKAVRAIDPNRGIFFTTRGSNGLGAPVADFSQWAALGNVAFDVHDFFGGRWGGGLDVSGDPSSDSYTEQSQNMYSFTLNLDAPVYLGTVAGQQRFVHTYLDRLSQYGIPVYIGEFTGNTEGNPRDPDILAVHGEMTQAFNELGVSWTALSYDGYHSVFNPNGTLRPWLPILCQAAAFPQHVTDCPVVP
jgi:aryl-phospho-beta-D-glucosidase BglC (GH1 family)